MCSLHVKKSLTSLSPESALSMFSNHLSSWVFQDPSREMAQTALLQPGSCQVLPPGLKPPGVSQPADGDRDCLDPDRDGDGDCLDPAKDSRCCPML